jgi:phytoene desaturase
MGSKRSVAVVGAGPGGLAAAMLLSARGFEVTVLEKKPVIGGRSARLQLGDYSFDMGATFLMMPYVLEECFALSGRRLEDYVTLKPLTPLYQLRFGETHFSPSSDPKETKAMIEELFPGNGERFTRFMQDEEIKFKRVSPLLQRPFNHMGDLLKKDVWKALPRLHAADTVAGRLERYFDDERLRWAFSFQSKYLGMSPWECPGTFTMLSYLEHRFGLYHPIGGINRLFDAMAQVIREYGGTIRTDTGVRQIQVEDGRATGVQLESGEVLTVDDVVINADFSHTVTTLFEPGILKKYTPEKIRRKKFSCSTFMMYLGVNRPLAIPHHTVLFSGDYRRNVEEITQTKVLPQEPSIYVHNPGITDPTLAPPGKTALYVLMPVPNLTGNIDWEKETQEARTRVIRRLEQEPELQGISQYIEEEKILTPQQWQDECYVYQGATFNLAHSLDQMMVFRPHNRFEEVAHCWLVGGGTHPGSGLPTIFESAKISSRLLTEQYQPHDAWVPVGYGEEIASWK